MGGGPIKHVKGRIPQIPGVLEIEFNELDIGSEIGSGGFSIIKRGSWRGTDTAIKIIFDPEITEDLLDEITNEVRMLSILRHPNIVTLMGMSTHPPNIAIVFENVEGGSLFDYLHMGHKEISMEQSLRIARDSACAIDFMH